MAAPALSLGAELATVRVLMRRALNELFRVPGAAIPGILAPTIFGLGLTAVFGELTALGPEFGTDEYLTWLAAVGFLQGAAFTGAATGVNLARDIELGWFDRLLVSPAARGTLLAGTVLSASLRALLPMVALIAVGLPLGMDWPGVDGLLIAAFLGVTFAAAVACWSATLALRFRTQAAAPMMQAGAFMATLFTTAYAPQELLTGWLDDVAKWNPVTLVLEGARQGFVGSVTWADTWPALVSVFAIALVLATLALRGMRGATG